MSPTERIVWLEEMQAFGEAIEVVADWPGALDQGLAPQGRGAVYLFRRTTGAFVQRAYLKAPAGDSALQFGNRLALSGEGLLVSHAGGLLYR